MLALRHAPPPLTTCAIEAVPSFALLRASYRTHNMSRTTCSSPASSSRFKSGVRRSSLLSAKSYQMLNPNRATPVAADYVLVLFAAGGRNYPALSWFWSAWSSLGRPFRKNLRRLVRSRTLCASQELVCVSDCASLRACVRCSI